LTDRSAFGLTLRTDIDLPWPAAPAADARRPVTVAVTDRETLVAQWSGTSEGPTWDTTFPGGRRVTVERGVAGDQLFRYAERDHFLISADARSIRCDPAQRDEPSWLRFLLDTVLWWTALANGLHVLHAGAVEIDGGVVGVLSASGGGKSTLAGALLLGGATLVSDDVLVLEAGDELTAHPGPPLMNLPATRDDLRALGRPIATLSEGDEEVWTAIDRVALGPLPVRALFVYTRGHGLPLGVASMRPTVLDLTPHAWAIPDDMGATRRRFALLADVAERVPVFGLTAGATEPPARIAETLMNALH
jgi:hypothetical protein